MKQTLIGLLLLAAIASLGQEKRQTQIISALFICTDTTHYAKGQNLDYEQSIKAMGFSFQIQGFVKQELHNTSEGVMDPGFEHCIDDQGNEISCYSDFWVTVKNLGPNKKPLPSSLIIWQTRLGK